MKKIFFLVFIAVILCFQQTVFAQTGSGKSFFISVTDNRKVITRDINQKLLLRVVKDSSVKYKHFGWLVEVVRKPYRRSSKNLIYENQLGVGADRSQVYAWHVANNEFPNVRRLKVRGYPYLITISLIDPQTKGSAENARFLSGKLRIEWTPEPE